MSRVWKRWFSCVLKAISHSTDQVYVQGILCGHVVKHSVKVYTETFAKGPCSQLPLSGTLLLSSSLSHAPHLVSLVCLLQPLCYPSFPIRATPA